MQLGEKSEESKESSRANSYISLLIPLGMRVPLHSFHRRTGLLMKRKTGVHRPQRFFSIHNSVDLFLLVCQAGEFSNSGTGDPPRMAGKEVRLYRESEIQVFTFS